MDYTTMMQSVPQMAAAYHTMALSDGQPRPTQMYSFAYNSDPLFLVPHIPHRDSVDHSQAGMQSKQTEPKPRLAKDEVDLLENEFKKNPKPSSQRKREIADILKVENPRINNWFQNRRAKAKQMLRREIDTKATGDESSSETPSDQPEDCTVSEYYSSSNHSQPLQASSAAFPTVEQQQQQLAFFTSTTDASVTNSASPSVEEYPSPRSLVFPPVHDLSSYAPAMNGYLTSDGSPCHETLDNEHALHGFDPSSMAAFVPFTTNMGMDSVMAPQPVPYHSELMGMDGMPQLSKESVANLSHEAQALQHGMPLPIQQLSSPISSHSPSSAASDLRFKSPPPPANIANRRNKGAPAMLNPTALRNGPYGPKTGIDMGKRIDAPTPIRRISSANGLINRIQKPAMAPVPRSPLYFERNKDVLMHSLQTAAAGGPASLVRSASSISPVTPHECIASYNHGMLEASSSVVSEDEAYSVSSSMQHPFFSMGQTLKTPPGTPGFNGGHVEQQASIDPWSFAPQDEALLTPSLGSFGSEEFAVLSSAPAYALNSQPPTPSFGQQAGHNYFHMQFQGGEGQAEFAFPGEPSMPPGFSAKSSPGRPKGKQFQFTQNITPDDFFSIEK